MNYGTTVDERRAVELLDTFVGWRSWAGGARRCSIACSAPGRRCRCSTTRSRTTRPT